MIMSWLNGPKKSSLPDPRYRQCWYLGRVGYPDDSFYLRPINGVWQFIANSGQEAGEVIDDYTELSNLLAGISPDPRSTGKLWDLNRFLKILHKFEFRPT